MTCKWLTGKHCKKDVMYGPSVRRAHTQTTKKQYLKKQPTEIIFFPSHPFNIANINEIHDLMFDTLRDTSLVTSKNFTWTYNTSTSLGKRVLSVVCSKLRNKTINQNAKETFTQCPHKFIYAFGHCTHDEFLKLTRISAWEKQKHVCTSFHKASCWTGAPEPDIQRRSSFLSCTMEMFIIKRSLKGHCNLQAPTFVREGFGWQTNCITLSWSASMVQSTAQFKKFGKLVNFTAEFD